jgi:hypothetical protein
MGRVLNVNLLHKYSTSKKLYYGGALRELAMVPHSLGEGRAGREVVAGRAGQNVRRPAMSVRYLGEGGDCTALAGALADGTVMTIGG